MEYLECLERNIHCSSINEICVLAEAGAEVPASQKVRVRAIARRPHYTNYFEWINEIASADDVSLIANADIFFDDGIGVLGVSRMAPHTALALSRWEVKGGGGVKLNDRNDSQDAWAFSGKIDGIFGDFPLGVARCDNRFVKELELAGYRVTNPSFSIRSYHLHAGARPEYDTGVPTGFVPPPYGYVWPHNFLPLHRTLLHNLAHRDHKVSWRLDKRLLSRKLKFHWFRRAVSVATRPFKQTGGPR